MSTEKPVSLTESRQQLAQARKDLVQATINTETTWQVVVATSEYAFWAGRNEHLQAVKNDVAAADEWFRSVLLDEHFRTGEKKFLGASIKEFTVVEFDEAEATEWAKTNVPALMVLDTKKYKKLAPDVGGPCTVTKEPRVYVDSNLEE